MLDDWQASHLPLPKGWPERVRSAVVHAISIAQFSIVYTRSWAANNRNARIRLKTQNDRLHQEVALLTEEMRIKDARMLRIPAQRRPHYPPIERLAILELRAARNWNAAQTARRLLDTSTTVASWTTRLDDEGADSIVRMREPVNKFPDFVAYIVRRLKVLCPSMGKVKIAQVLCRIGLHLSPSSVGRYLNESYPPPSRAATKTTQRAIRATRPHHIWLCDLTTVPTSLGFWTSWLPWALPQQWPFCWWVTVVVDHYSRRAVSVAAFPNVPTSGQIRAFLGRAVQQVRSGPKHLITDDGGQFIDAGFQQWCRRRGIQQRFGAVGKYGSVSVIERFIRTLKDECTRLLIVPYQRDSFRRELIHFINWYNEDRPHTRLDVRTPNEVYFGKSPAGLAPRFEPRRRWPRGSPCARPFAEIDGRRGARLEPAVNYRAGRKHLPVVTLRRAA